VHINVNNLHPFFKRVV